MKKINRTYLLSITFLTLLTTIIMTIGCGGGGGGSGRQILPGENPTGPITGTGTGTSTSTGTSTGTGTGTSTGTGTGTGTTVSQKIDSGWAEMSSSNLYGAILYFDSAISDSRTTDEQRKQAYNGRGWAKVKYTRTTDGISDFIMAGDIPESLLGYAMGLVQQSTSDSVSKAVDIFEQLGLGDENAQLQGIEHQIIGITSAEAHAMLAYAYFWRGQSEDGDKARKQILAAREVDKSETSTVGQIYNTLKKAGLTGI